MSPNQSPEPTAVGAAVSNRERKAPWGHAPLRGSRREPAVAQLFSLGSMTRML